LAALHGATLLVVPTNFAEDAVGVEFSNPDGWDLTTRFYAMIYGMPLVMANRVGTGWSCSAGGWGGHGAAGGAQPRIGVRPRVRERFL
jgi:predicted amidohydrolase